MSEGTHFLAAIVSADCVAYSRRMAEDEAGTIRIVEALRPLVATEASAHSGRVVDFTGDNFLALFSSALDAVRFALALRQRVEDEVADLPAAPALRFRMGIHLGDVRSEGPRVFGGSVNVAARLEALAPDGGVCLSGIVADEIRNKLDLPLRDLGEQTLKNIPGRVRAYAVEAGRGRRPRARVRGWAAAILLAGALGAAVLGRPVPGPVSGADARFAAAPTPAPLSAIAVLPFADMTAGADHGYLADGFAEEIIHELARSRSLRVLARTSSFAFRGDGDVRELAARLGVGSLLEGSVRREGTRVRVTAQLIQARDGFHLWSQSFDLELQSALDTQTAIAVAVRQRVEGRVGVAEHRNEPPRSRGSVSPQAYDAYLRGRYFLNRRPEGLEKAEAHFGRCLEADPDHARCHAGLSETLFQAWSYTPDPARDPERVRRARHHAARANALAPDLAEAWTALALVHGYDWQWARESAALDRALGLSPGSADIRRTHSIHLARLGQLGRAADEAARAAALDPLSPIVQRHAGLVALFAGDPDASVRYADASLALKPGEPRALLLLSRAELRAGREERSLAAFSHLAPWWVRPALRAVGRVIGVEGAMRLSSRFELARTPGRCGDVALATAWYAAVAGDRDRLFDCLNEGADEQRIEMPLADPVYAPYRDDARFAAYLDRVGLRRR